MGPLLPNKWVKKLKMSKVKVEKDWNVFDIKIEAENLNLAIFVIFFQYVVLAICIEIDLPKCLKITVVMLNMLPHLCHFIYIFLKLPVS